MLEKKILNFSNKNEKADKNYSEEFTNVKETKQGDLLENFKVKVENFREYLENEKENALYLAETLLSIREDFWNSIDLLNSYQIYNLELLIKEKESEIEVIYEKLMQDIYKMKELEKQLASYEDYYKENIVSND